MRRDKRDLLKWMGLSALSMMVAGGGAWAGDIVESYLTNVRVLEFSLNETRVDSLGDGKNPVWSNRFESLVNEFLRSEVERDPILRDVIVRSGFPAKPWIPGVLELGLKVVVEKVDSATYVAGINRTYRRLKLRNRERLNDRSKPLTSADFEWTNVTSLPSVFLISAADATDPSRLAETIFKKYENELTLDLKRISHIKSVHNE